MARWSGVIGFAETQETVPGVWEEVIVEKKFFGDLLSDSRELESADKQNFDVDLSNRISIVANKYTRGAYMNIRYVKLMGSLFQVPSVSVDERRLILRVGGIWNGDTPRASPEADNAGA